MAFLEYMNFIGICCLQFCQFVEIMPFIFFVSLDENDPKGTTFLCSPRDFLVVQYFRGLVQSLHPKYYKQLNEAAQTDYLGK